jgi:hypothetical protein
MPLLSISWLHPVRLACTPFFNQYLTYVLRKPLVLTSALDPAFVWAMAKSGRRQNVVDVVVHENTRLSRKPAPFRSLACVAVTLGLPDAFLVHRSGTLSTWHNSGSLLPCTVSCPSKHRAHLVEIRPRDLWCFLLFIFDQYPPSNLLRVRISPLPCWICVPLPSFSRRPGVVTCGSENSPVSYSTFATGLTFSISVNSFAVPRVGFFRCIHDLALTYGVRLISILYPSVI